MAQKSRPKTGPRRTGAPRPETAALGQPAGPSQQVAPTAGRGQIPAQSPTIGTPATARLPSGPARSGKAATASSTASPLRRQEQRRRSQGKATSPNRRPGVVAAGALVAVLVIVAAVVTRSILSGPTVRLNQTEQPPSAAGIHVAVGSSIQYEYNPPSSGPHYPSPANWGIYPQALPPGTWVHNLEHGGIVLLYQCPSSCADVQAQLQTVYSQLPQEQQFHERKVVLTPYANLDHLLRIQAWGWTMSLDTVDTAAIDAFYNEHVDKGPEQIP